MTTTLPPADLRSEEAPDTTHDRPDREVDYELLPVYLVGGEGPQAGTLVDLTKQDQVQQPDPEAEARAALIQAEADKAAAEAERLRLANRRGAMRTEQDEATHAAKMAKLTAEREAAEREAAQEKAAAEAARERVQAEADEKKSAERNWRLGALGIYIAGAVVSMPLQVLAFYKPDMPFLLSAPFFLEGLALVLSFGAAAAVTAGRPVWPYRVGVMVAAVIAAAVNVIHGNADPRIGIGVGAIGAVTSIGGPIVWTAYEHGRARRLDGVPTRRERNAAAKAAAAELRRLAEEAERAEAEAIAKAEAKAAEDEKKAADKAAADLVAAEDQARRDEERQAEHPEVWAVAVARRTATGSAHVTEQIWAAAWEVVHGTKEVGVTASIRAMLLAARAAMQQAGEGFEGTAKPQVESQTPRRDPDAEDGRKSNGGTPPVRRAGDAQKYLPGVGKVSSTATVTRVPRRPVRGARKK
ncbi:hypothetical protein [Kitasatospora kifunensis]|uniref:SpdB2 protein n=1 Tax=Kitasatospora kifunensis TaxID=58351 RepID=A0A7W7RC02_KITKI|nr:hypothetical protein [Kitasatospora kifunensis]MBB4929177.1 hypothetical protein [Kitasatospora kifunensis]